MKLLSQFKKCYGFGATIAPATEPTTTIVTPPPPEAESVLSKSRHLQQEPCSTTTSTPTNSRRLTKSHTTTRHWKPALSVITEDRVSWPGADEINRVNGEGTVRSEEKALVKSKSTTTSPSPSYCDDYRKSRRRMAISAFSPSPFGF